MSVEQIELGIGEKLREEGIARVLERNPAWNSSALAFFKAWIADKPGGYEFIGETFRLEAAKAGVPAPNHHNAWGGFFARLPKQRGAMVQATGRYVKARTASAHARMCLIYRKP